MTPTTPTTPTAFKSFRCTDWVTKNYFPPQPKNWHNGTTGMVGKEVTPNTFSRHNQKTVLCNQKLFPAATKKRYNGTTGMVGKYQLKLFPSQPKTDTTAQLEKCSSSPRVASVFVSLSVCLSVRAKRGIWSKRVFMRMNGNFSFSVGWRNTTIIH